MKRLGFALLCVCLLAGPAGAKPPSWDTLASGSKRFRVLKAFAEQAVLDSETGLVWSQGWAGTAGWSSTLQYCLRASIGGRLGWRIPLAHEMMSLVDPATNTLPEGHPFDVGNVTSFWTGTTAEVMAGTKDHAYAVSIDGSEPLDVVAKTTNGPAVLCVRGPGGTDNL